jgi:predicted CopG family antitoxin
MTIRVSKEVARKLEELKPKYFAGSYDEVIRELIRRAEDPKTALESLAGWMMDVRNDVKTLFGLKYHFKTVHSARLSTCPICGRRCKNSNGLTRHCARMMRLGCAEHGALFYLLSGGAWVSKRLGAFKREVLEVLRCGGLDCLRRSYAPTAVVT